MGRSPCIASKFPHINISDYLYIIYVNQSTSPCNNEGMRMVCFEEASVCKDFIGGYGNGFIQSTP